MLLFIRNRLRFLSHMGLISLMFLPVNKVTTTVSDKKAHELFLII